MLALTNHITCSTLLLPLDTEITPQVGAGISLAPNGLRVLDQLGLAQRVAAEVGEPIHTMHASRPNDSTIVEFPTMAQEV
jgi:2-polyprenyl-6-methoxyphenol hydroxylase-like FAD-dependent oxidoreductase